jgi:hypothetical protein
MLIQSRRGRHIPAFVGTQCDLSRPRMLSSCFTQNWVATSWVPLRRHLLGSRNP